MHVRLNPALLYSVSDLTKHIWLAHINQTCFSWLFLSLHSSPSLSLSDRTDQWISFCVAVVSHSVLSTWPLSCTLTQCFIRLFGAVRELLHSFGSAVWKALLGFSYWLTTLSWITTLKTSPPTESGQLYHFCSHFYTSYMMNYRGLICLLKREEQMRKQNPVVGHWLEQCLS